MENEIKVGEYVRFRNGNIDKVTHIEEDTNKMWFDNTSGRKTIISIVKHSKNIIDLIEVGDYVNGEKVYERFESKLYLEGDTGEIFIMSDGTPDEDIETIVTKEQFESISYKVERKARTSNDI